MNLLVIRMSAMGDVALTLVAIRSALDHYPEINITIVTRKQFIPFFEHIDRLTIVVADVKQKHKGFYGLYKLYREIKQHQKIDAVLDLHDVLRSHILSFYFRMIGVPVFRIDKGRKEKKQLTAKKNKQFRQLKHIVARYLNVFKDAGYSAELSSHKNWFNHAIFPESFIQKSGGLPKRTSWIGIAPFAKHREKIWPLEKMEALIEYLVREGNTIFLFGGGQHEINILEQLRKKYKYLVVVAGNLTLEEELGLISRLDVMISMDSANMHLAALSGVTVVSIWGPTHPFAGFAPIGDNEKLIVQIPHDKLACRPCSVYGNKPCWRGDHACMEGITKEMVLEKIARAAKS